MVALLGLFAWLSIGLLYLIRYGFLGPFVLAEGVDQVVGRFVGGLAMAGLVRPR